MLLRDWLQKTLRTLGPLAIPSSRPAGGKVPAKPGLDIAQLEQRILLSAAPAAAPLVMRK